ncbi:MAG TPA: metallophosphoesterase [Actinomycetes bacterium]|nr:metallophosphoesterase [Actinomycetes bacterium]
MKAEKWREHLRRDIHWRTLGKFLVVVAVAMIGATVGLLIAGSRTDQVGPLIVRSTVSLTATGDTRIDVPPLGSISLDSHDGPLGVHAEVEGIDSDATAGLIAGAADIGTRDEVLADVRSMLIRTYLQAFAVMVLGATLAVLLVWRRPRRALLTGGITAGLVLVSGGVGVATWNNRALAQPRYSGLLVYAPRIVGSADEVINNFELYGDQLARLVDNVSKLSSAVTSLPNFEPDPQTVRVLHVSDIHLNPSVWPIMRTIIQQYDVDVVVDTGDIADHGTTAEVPFVDPIGSLGVPYVYVKGNHDSTVIENAIAQQPNGVVLTGDPVKVAGLRFLGDADPRFTPDKDTTATSEEVVAEGQRLADTAAGLRHPVDVVMVHDPTAAPPLVDAAPLVLAGHVHERRSEQLDDDTLLLVQGSTGGAGLRALESEEPTPLTFTVLYFNRTSGQLQARDEITLGGLGTASAEVTRILSPTESTGRTP